MEKYESGFHYGGPICLVILDGFGLSDQVKGNAIKAANAPTLNRLMTSYPMQKLKASGAAVGLPSDDDIGNSEVGHNAMGAGRVYAQGARLVNEAMESGTIFQGAKWRELVENAKNGHTLHFIGLLSDGNVHSNISHLYRMLDEAKNEGVQKVRVHILLDGRDVEPTSALKYVNDLEWKLGELNNGDVDYRIASGGGRMQITMDRYEANWPMVELGWKTHVLGEGRQFDSAVKAVETYRKENPGVIDQDIPPFVIAENGEPIGKIASEDSVILWNFRGDRSQELARAFEAGPDFAPFDRGTDTYHFASLLEYDSDKHIPKSFLVSPPEFKNTLGEFLARHGVMQLALSETQKFGHVTYFFNGNHANKFNKLLEDYVEIPSDRVAFDTAPKMKSKEIANTFNDLASRYTFIRVNFPNPDMVGHTGNFEATVEAIEAVDMAVAKMLPRIDELGGMMILTGDHGNAEEMLDEHGQPKTAHTTNRVPCIFYDHTENALKYSVKGGDEFGLTNLAATISELAGLKPLAEWDESMIEVN